MSPLMRPFKNSDARAPAVPRPLSKLADSERNSCSKPSLARTGSIDAPRRKSMTPSTMPAAIKGRRSGAKLTSACVVIAPELARSSAVPGSDGGNSSSCARPASMKVCTPGSSGFRSRTRH